ncbi:hypothetical protein NLM16_38420 [Bradyrhizobium brasilense]|uniref:hypothetical protein n=1 Tax=Bradyrhizobium brasilense TaxID=1419277 RepID=UPI002877899E|nr:hypothetical protein [Bradyrhizobium brasilense]MCP3419991.1 hypothetical protein [Bradyrhizobium brasilense]
MSELRNYILKRQADIEEASRPVLERFTALKNEIDKLRPQIEAFQAEWMELQSALKAIGPGNDSAAADQAAASKPMVTIKEAILAVLAKRPAGLSSSAILNAINKDYFHGNEIMRTSFSPQLSRLKAREDILLEGNNYILNPKKQDQAPQPELFVRQL